jgi:hypothetical protein
MVTLVTVSVTPSTVTVNAEALGPVAPNVSLKVSTAAPEVFTADETKTGATVSVVELFIATIADELKDIASFPTLS